MKTLAELVNIMLAIENTALEQGNIPLLLRARKGIALLEKAMQEHHRINGGVGYEYSDSAQVSDY